MGSTHASWGGGRNDEDEDGFASLNKENGVGGARLAGKGGPEGGQANTLGDGV